MVENDFKGLGVALATPFKRDLSVDYEALEKIINHTIDGGCDYIVALGTTAETPTLSLNEKKEVAGFIADKAAGRIPLILGIGGNDTLGVIRDIKSRDLAGYSAILSVAPYYNKPNQEGLYQHFHAIAENSPLPIILYNVPGRTGVNITSHTTKRLSLSTKNIIGIKEASGKLDQCGEILKDCRPGFQLISGNDGDIVSIMKMGGCGVISVLANAYPKAVKNIVALCQKGNFDEAEKKQTEFEGVIKRLFEEGNPAGVKFLLSELGLAENILRLPLVPVSSDLEKKLTRDKELFL